MVQQVKDPSTVTAEAWITAVVQVQSLAQELTYAVGVAKTKTKATTGCAFLLVSIYLLQVVILPTCSTYIECQMPFNSLHKYVFLVSESGLREVYKPSRLSPPVLSYIQSFIFFHILPTQ